MREEGVGGRGQLEHSLSLSACCPGQLSRRYHVPKASPSPSEGLCFGTGVSGLGVFLYLEDSAVVS